MPIYLWQDGFDNFLNLLTGINDVNNFMCIIDVSVKFPISVNLGFFAVFYNGCSKHAAQHPKSCWYQEMRWVSLEFSVINRFLCSVENFVTNVRFLVGLRSTQPTGRFDFIFKLTLIAMGEYSVHVFCQSQGIYRAV